MIGRPYFLIGLFFFILSGCATSLRGIPIDAHRVHVEMTGHGLVPGEGYYIRLEFRNARNGEWITSPDTKDYVITSKTPLAEVRGKRYIQTRPFSFALIQRPYFEFDVHLLTNEYVIPPLSYPVRWSAGNTFILNGEDGEEPWGNHGGHGKNGPNITVEIAEYDVSGTPLGNQQRYYLVHLPQNKALVLVRDDMSPVEISSRGGKGGKGSEGPSRSLQRGQTEVYGERGYDGGDGGDGGTITLRYPPGREDLLNLLQVDVSGGEAGKGGEGGRGEKARTGDPNVFDVLGAVLGVNRGPVGRDGRSGRSGSVERQATPLAHMFNNIQSEGFERERLR